MEGEEEEIKSLDLIFESKNNKASRRAESL